MVRLADLGFTKGIIFETIVSTYNPDGTVNAAPMGVRMEDQQSVTLNIYNSATTTNNLKTNKCAVINLTRDVVLFYKSTFKEANPDGKLPANWFKMAETVNAPKLRKADATIEIDVKVIEPNSLDTIKFVCAVNKIITTKKYPQVYCRAMSATIEAIIDATRVKTFISDDEKQNQVPMLLKRIENHIHLVNRVAPNSTYSTIMTDLMKKIELWRNKA